MSASVSFSVSVLQSMSVTVSIFVSELQFASVSCVPVSESVSRAGVCV